MRHMMSSLAAVTALESLNTGLAVSIQRSEEQLKAQDDLLIKLQKNFNKVVDKAEQWENNMKELNNEYDKMELTYKVQIQDLQADNDRLKHANQIAITNMAAAQSQVQNLLSM